MALTMLNLTYHSNGTYLEPDLEPLTPPKENIGKYGMLRLDYLREHKTWELSELILSDTINEHLVEIDQIATTQVMEAVNQMKKEIPMPDQQIKPIEWAKMLKMLTKQAEEVVSQDLIYR